MEKVIKNDAKNSSSCADIIKLTNEWLDADTQHYKPESTYDPNSEPYNAINKVTKILNVNMAEIVKNQEAMSSLKIDFSVIEEITLVNSLLH